MINDSQMLAWQKEREEADRRERHEERERDRAFQDKQAKASRRHQWLTLIVAVTAVAIAAYREFLKPDSASQPTAITAPKP